MRRITENEARVRFGEHCTSCFSERYSAIRCREDGHLLADTSRPILDGCSSNVVTDEGRIGRARIGRDCGSRPFGG